MRNLEEIISDLHQTPRLKAEKAFQGLVQELRSHPREALMTHYMHFWTAMVEGQRTLSRLPAPQHMEAWNTLQPTANVVNGLSRALKELP